MAFEGKIRARVDRCGCVTTEQVRRMSRGENTELNSPENAVLEISSQRTGETIRKPITCNPKIFNPQPTQDSQSPRRELISIVQERIRLSNLIDKWMLDRRYRAARWFVEMAGDFLVYGSSD
jgi:hypothetical protein